MQFDPVRRRWNPRESGVRVPRAFPASQCLRRMARQNDGTKSLRFCSGIFKATPRSIRTLCYVTPLLCRCARAIRERMVGRRIRCTATIRFSTEDIASSMSSAVVRKNDQRSRTLNPRRASTILCLSHAHLHRSGADNSVPNGTGVALKFRNRRAMTFDSVVWRCHAPAGTRLCGKPSERETPDSRGVPNVGRNRIKLHTDSSICRAGRRRAPRGTIIDAGTVPPP